LPFKRVFVPEAGFLKRPLLLEGDAGVSKAEIGKGLAAIQGSELIRLQCYEDLTCQAAPADVAADEQCW
jgi:MoxR-like ATPase